MSTRRPRCRATVAVLLSFALVTAASACSGEGDDAVATTAVPATASSAPGEGAVDVGDGLLVTDPSVATQLHASIDPTTVAGALPYAPAGPLFHVVANREPDAPVVIHVPVTSVPADEALPIVMVAADPGGPWEALPTDVQLVAGAAVATTTHFSWFTTLFAPVADLVGEARRIVDGATGDPMGEAHQPACAAEDDVRTRLAITSSDGPTVTWCLGAEGGRDVLRVVNGTKYPLLATTSGLSVIEDDIDGLWPHVAALATAGATLLVPDTEVTFAIDAPGATLSTSFDGVGFSLYQLQVGVETALGFLTRFGLQQAPGAWRYIDALVSGSRCGDTLETLGAGELMANCFTPAQIFDAFGAAAVFIAPLLVAAPLVGYFRAAFQGLRDVLTGRDRYDISIGAATPPAPPPTTVSTAVPDCSDDAIRRDLGADARTIDGLCTDGWLYADTCTGECGDSDVVARLTDGTWEVIVRFPTATCRGDLAAQGAPAAILDRIVWPCDSSGGGPSAGELRVGSRGPAVEALQRALVSLGYLSADEVDGQFGPRVEAAVKAFQRSQGLVDDGVAGPRTLAALGLAGTAAPATTTIACDEGSLSITPPAEVATKIAATLNSGDVHHSTCRGTWIWIEYSLPGADATLNGLIDVRTDDRHPLFAYGFITRECITDVIDDPTVAAAFAEPFPSGPCPF